MSSVKKATRNVIMELFSDSSKGPNSPEILFDNENHLVVFKPQKDTTVNAYVGPRGITFVLHGSNGEFLLKLNKDLSIAYDWSDIKWAITNPEGSATHERIKIIHNNAKFAKGDRIKVKPNCFDLLINGKYQNWSKSVQPDAFMYLRHTDNSPSSTSLVNLFDPPENEYEVPTDDLQYSMTSELGGDVQSKVPTGTLEELLGGITTLDSTKEETPPASPSMPGAPNTVRKVRKSPEEQSSEDEFLLATPSKEKNPDDQTKSTQHTLVPRSLKLGQQDDADPNSPQRSRSSSTQRSSSRSSSTSSLSKKLCPLKEPMEIETKTLSESIEEQRSGVKVLLSGVQEFAKQHPQLVQTSKKESKKKSTKISPRTSKAKQEPGIPLETAKYVRDEVYKNLTHSKIYDGLLLNAKIEEKEDARSLGFAEEGKNIYTYLGKPNFEFLAGTLYIYVRKEERSDLESRIDSKTPKEKMIVSEEVTRALLLMVHDLHNPSKAAVALQSIHDLTENILSIQKITDPERKQGHAMEIPVDVFVNQIHLLNNKEHTQAKYKRIEKHSTYGPKSIAVLDARHLLRSKLMEANDVDALKEECDGILTRVFGQPVMLLVKKIQDQKLNAHSAVTTLQQIVVRVESILNQESTLEEKKSFLITLFALEAGDLVRSNDIVAQHTMIEMAQKIEHYFENFAQRESRVLAVSESQSEKFYVLIQMLVDAVVSGPRSHTFPPETQQKVREIADEIGKVRSKDATDRLVAGVRDCVNTTSLQKVVAQKAFSKSVPTEYQRSLQQVTNEPIIELLPNPQPRDQPKLSDNLKAYLESVAAPEDHDRAVQQMIEIMKENPGKSDHKYKVLFSKHQAG